MHSLRGPDPLLRWDGVHLVIDLGLVDRHLRRHLESWQHLRDVTITGLGDAIAISATTTYKGVATRLAVDLAEIRLKHRHLGFRLRRPRVLGGMRLPRRMVVALLGLFEIEGVTEMPAHGIVVVDLRPWLPPQLELAVRTVQASDRSLHIWLGPGAFTDLPGHASPALAAGSESTDRHGKA